MRCIQKTARRRRRNFLAAAGASPNEPAKAREASAAPQAPWLCLLFSAVAFALCRPLLFGFASSIAGAIYAHPFGAMIPMRDGNNMRVEKSAGSTSTVYIFSGSQVVAEYDNGAGVSSPSREYIYSGNQLISTIDSSGTKYHHPDHLSVRVTTDSSGNKIGEQGHFPFGEQWYASSTTTKYFFTSYERDSESENDYAQARYHVNRLGRFASPDPMAGSIADPQSLNRYSYTRNFPTGLTDRHGTCYPYVMNDTAHPVSAEESSGRDDSEYSPDGPESFETMNNEDACRYEIMDYVGNEAAGGAGAGGSTDFGGATMYVQAMGAAASAYDISTTMGLNDTTIDSNLFGGLGIDSEQQCSNSICDHWQGVYTTTSSGQVSSELIDEPYQCDLENCGYVNYLYTTIPSSAYAPTGQPLFGVGAPGIWKGGGITAIQTLQLQSTINNMNLFKKEVSTILMASGSLKPVSNAPAVPKQTVQPASAAQPSPNQQLLVPTPGPPGPSSTLVPTGH